MPRNDLIDRRILLVDAKATNCEIIQQEIKNWGMKCACAASAEQALEMARQAAADNPFEIALLDMHLPNDGGIELARQLKAAPDTAGIQLVMIMSGWVEVDAKRAKEAGVNYHLYKPVRQSELYDCLVKALCGDRATTRLSTPENIPPEEKAQRSSARILLAEDNVINQQVALSFLQTLGFHADIANNGEEAVQAAAQKKYDLIFMDCLMPKMDGFKATTMLRKLEEENSGGEQAHTPIVALTANALHADREKCLAAGMDDYLSKPFSTEQLQAILKRWLPQPTAGSDSPAAQPGPQPSQHTITSDVPPAPAAILDQVALNQIRDLQGPGNEDVLERFINLYFENSADLLEDLRQGVKQQNAETIRATAHPLKSSSASLGAMKLAKLFEQLEGLGRENRLDGAPDLLSQAEAAYNEACTALRDEIKASGS